MRGFLKEIVKGTRMRIEREYRDYSPRIGSRKSRSLIDSIRGCEKVPIIAEIKPASPTMGVLRASLDPAGVAMEMEEGGAIGISVITEPLYFKGSMENLGRVRCAVKLPVLMKDFIIDERQIQRAAEEGADAILLMPSICDLAYLHQVADRYGLEALVEVHSADEVKEAIEVGARLIGINNRDLATLKIDLKTTSKLIPIIRDLCDDVTIVSMSGVTSPQDVQYLVGEGADALLVGTSIMGAEDVAAKIRRLTEGI